MLTPIEIQGKTFKNSGMGYSKADVDSFFSSVSADFEALYKAVSYTHLTLPTNSLV